MTKESKPLSYFYADRMSKDESQSIFENVAADVKTGAHHIDLKDGDINFNGDVKDFLYICAGSMDAMLMNRSSQWENGDTPRFLERRRGKKIFTQMIRSQNNINRRNRECIEAIGMSASVDAVARLGVEMGQPCVTPLAKMTVLETWTRLAATFAYAPAYRELIGKKTPLGPGFTLKSQDVCIDALAAVSNTMRYVRDYVLRNNMTHTQSDAHRTRGLKGVLAEHDVLLSAVTYEPLHNEEKEKGFYFPAPLNLDVGPNNSLKGDILFIITDRLGRKSNGISEAILFDVKTKMPKKKKGNLVVPDYSCIKDLSLGFVDDSGSASSGHIVSARQRGEGINREEVFAKGLSVLGIDIVDLIEEQGENGMPKSSKMVGPVVMDLALADQIRKKQ